MKPRAIPCPQRHPMVSTGPCVRPRLWRDGLGIMHQIPGVVELAIAFLELAPYLTEFLDRSQVVLVAFPGALVDVDPYLVNLRVHLEEIERHIDGYVPSLH